MKLKLLIACCMFTTMLMAQKKSKQQFTEAKLNDLEIPSGSRIILNKLYFQPANFLPTQRSEIYLDSLAMIMKRDKDLHLELCYIQTVWPKTVDVDISIGRSETLKEFMEERGIRADRISTTSTTHLFDPEEEDLNKDVDKKNYYIEARFFKK